MNKKWSGLFGKATVVGIVVLTVIFAADVLDVVRHGGAEPTALVMSWFTFATGELGLCAAIKNSKAKKEKGDKKHGSNTQTGQNED